MSLPETTTEDLRRMGITPEAIRDQIERGGHPVDGKIVGYFLPPDNWKSYPTIRARNNLKSDWHAIKTNPPEIVKVEDYDQSFDNFDGDEPLQFTFTHSVQVVTAEDYTQTQRFEVSVNASIPLGQSGALLGFNASMSAEDVKHKSKSETVTREISFPLTVPAGEGRIVNEKTTVKSIMTLFEAALCTQGSVGIEVDPGFWTPNYNIWYTNIEKVFPYAEATSRISRSATSTNIDTKVIKMPKEGDGTEAEIVEYHSFNSDIALVEFEGPCIAFSSTGDGSPPDHSPFSNSMKIKVQFSGEEPEVPLKKRQLDTEELKAFILTRIASVGNPSDTIYGPDFSSTSFSIAYDPDKITNAELGAAVIKQAQDIQWGGQYVITFS